MSLLDKPLPQLSLTLAVFSCYLITDKWLCSYNWVGGGVIGGNTSCIHGRCGDWRVGLRIQRRWAGTQWRTYSYTGQTLGCVFYCLTSCDGERVREREWIHFMKELREKNATRKSWARSLVIALSFHLSNPNTSEKQPLVLTNKKKISIKIK